MRRYITAIVIFSLVFLGLSSLSHGAGFLIYEHGAAAMAMGGAFVAVANNSTAIFHNPAGIAFLEGTQISFGTTLITSNSSLNLSVLDTTVDTVKQWHYPPTFYISHQISEKVVAGFGFFVPYGLGVEWPEDYPLKYISIRDDMKNFFFNPTLAFKVSENFSLGFGVSYIYSTLEFELVEHVVRTLDPAASGLPISVQYTMDVPLVLDATGSAWGLNAGALYKGENFSIGFNWRGGFKIEFDGDLVLSDPLVDVTIPPPWDTLLPAGTAEAVEASIAGQVPSEGGALIPSFNFPHIFGIGIAFNLTESLIMSADVHYLLWSTFDEFTVEVDVPGFDDKHVEENWTDSFVFRGGLEYNLNESFVLRAGFLYDQTPQPVATMDPILPDSNRWAITGGFGYKRGNFVINVAYQYEPFQDRESENRGVLLHPVTGTNLGVGTYSTTAHLFGISMGFVF
jgi:long-chain fatty acid transport protein